MKRSHRLALAGALAAIAVLLAACGSSSSSSDTSASSSGGSTSSGSSKLTKSTIKIGMPNADSGAEAEAFGKGAEVAKAWEEWVNSEEGGINGHPVEVVEMDTKGDPATASTDAQQMIADGVVAEVGGQDSVGGPVWAKAFTEAKIPVIGGEMNDPAFSESPYFFRLAPSVLTFLPLTVDAAKAVGATKFAAAVCSENAACAQAGPLWEEEAKRIGVDWAGLSKVSASAPNYIAPCLAVQESGADYLELAVNVSTALKMIEDCNRQDVTFNYYGITGGTMVVPELAPATEGSEVKFNVVLGGFPWWVNKPAFNQYRKVMEKYATLPEVEPATATWSALEMFRTAMADAGEDPTAEEVAEAMWKVKDEDLGGLLPEPVSFTKGKPSADLSCSYTGNIEDGGLTGGKVECLK